MTGPDAAATFARNLFTALAGLGVRHAIISPGSRNTALAMAAASEPGMRATVVLDERSAGFTALGLAKSTRDPVVTICTSGSAAAHHHPAVVEASHARVPIIVITADRPPELRGTGAPQTIDQTALYGGSVKLFHDTGVPDDEAAAAAGRLALRLFAAAADAPNGPVHLNVPMREPLVGSAKGDPAHPPQHVPGILRLQPEGTSELGARLSGRRAIAVAGSRQRSGFGAAAAIFGLETGIPVVADIQCRHPGATTIASGDLLAGAGFLDREPPDVVLRLGGIPTSKPLWRWLETASVDQVWVDDGPWRDPLAATVQAFRADPTTTLGDLSTLVAQADASWTQAWLDADRTAAAAAAEAIDGVPFPNEPAVARITAASAPAGSLIYAGSSMPIRDLDTFAGAPRGIPVLANRGANGIDGLLSAAAGAALNGDRVICLTGDVGAIHDMNALVTIARDRLRVTVVVVNNDGGGIFHFLPQADPDVVDPALFERLFGTPHGVSFVPVAAALGVSSAQVADRDELTDAIATHDDGPRLLEVVTDRADNVAVHRRVREAVAAALG